MAQDNLDALTDAVMQAESRGRRFGSDAKKLLESVKGAQGEMQVMPKTQAKPGFGVEPAKDKSGDEIARVGRDYLKAMVGRYSNQVHALAAYNWGPGNTDKWVADGADMSKLPAETRKYIQEVQSNLQSRLTQQGPGKTKEPVKVEPMMDAVQRSGVSAQAPASAPASAQTILAQLGPNYQAALALNTIAEQDEKDSEDEGDKLDEWQRNKEMEAEIDGGTAKRALAALEGLSFQSPVAGEQQPVRMAAGGAIQLTPIAALSPAKKAQLGAAKADWDKYNTNATAYNDALTKYKTEKYEPYVNAVNHYNNRLEMQQNPGKLNVYGALGSTLPLPPIPTVPEEFTMVAPEQPKVEAAKVQAMAKSAAQDRNSRQTALDAAGNPEAYGLTINRIGFADGGSVHPPVYRADGSPMGGENVDHMTPQEIERMAAAQQPAFGTFPQMRPRRTVQDPEAAKNVPVDVARGVVAGTAGLIPDIVNFVGLRSPMPTEMFGDTNYEPKPQMPYGSEYYLKNLPLKNEAPVSKAAGQLGAMFPVVPVNTIRKGAAKAAEMLKSIKAPKASREESMYLMGGAHDAPPDLTAPPAPVAPPITQIEAPAAAMQTEIAAQARAPIPVTAEHPFVGRLDQFVADMTAPVQKQQFVNQVKNKFRDYDTDRVETALASFGPTDKITPVQLQEALSKNYSPSNWKVTDVKPGDSNYGIYEGLDNVYAPSKMGTTNLFIDQPAALKEASKQAENLEARLNSVYNFNASLPELLEIKTLINNNSKLAETPQGKAINTAVDYINKSYTSIQKAPEEINAITNGFLYPTLYTNAQGNRPYLDMVRQEAEVLARLRGVLSGDRPYYSLTQDTQKFLEAEAATKIERKIMEEANERLQRNFGSDPVDVSDVRFYADEVDQNFGRNTPGFEKTVEDAMELIWLQVQEAKKRIARHIKDPIAQVKKLLDEEKLYTGQHPTVTKDQYPIGFARFTEHEVQVPDQGMLKGRHYHELQSDLAQDIRDKGPKTGNIKKDEIEFDSLSEKRQKIMLNLVDNPPATEKARAAIDIEMAKLDDRIGKLNNRMIAAKRGGQTYYLEEPFAGTENRSSIVQQLLMKNAIQATIREGLNFVTFPGTASAQSHLYEGVRNNLKQVIKDLGGEKSGLELKMIELPPTTQEVINKRTGKPTHELGKPLNAFGVVWGPEAAARIIENGIPFAKGGMVERNTSDNRRYL